MTAQEECDPTPAAPQRPTAPIDGRERTILLVEDEEGVRELTALVLRRSGFRVLTAPDGPQSLGIWEREKRNVELLVTDVVMPGGLDGFDLAEKLRQEKPELKVLYLSGYNRQFARLNPTDERSGFLAKPFSIDELKNLARSLIETK